MKRKIISFILVLCMCFTMVPVLGLTSYAVSGSEIVSYARQFIGYPYGHSQGPDSFDSMRYHIEPLSLLSKKIHIN